MSDEYDNETYYSPFWPILILVAGLTLWCGYQAYSAYVQRSALEQQFQSAIPTINAAQGAQNRLVSLANDLLDTASKNPNAALIVKEAGITRTNNGTNAAPAAPAPAK